ncbi:acetate kinase [bacterium]|nr:acetate kinase [bacterium]
MLILVINCGSSSLKYTLFNQDREVSAGLVDRIGTAKSSFSRTVSNGKKRSQSVAVANHRQSIKLVVDSLVEDGVIAHHCAIGAVGHRVVHGGPRYADAVLVNQSVINDPIGRNLAPLHQVSYAGIEACLTIFPKIPQVAVFDTAFHQTLPEHAFTYALPHQLMKKHNIRKYGFHGTSHKYVTQEAIRILRKPANRTNLITLHLGNGSSISAIQGGKCVDTSMGLTPLAGVVMGTRCGDIDPAIVPFLMEKEKLSVREIDQLLNKKSGILGLSGVSNDLREVLAKAEKGSRRARLSLDVFIYSIQKYIGAYHAILGRTDAIVFTAGIGEKSPYLREKICERLFGIGIKIDKRKNAGTISQERFIHTVSAKVKILVLPTREEYMIARETRRVIDKKK